MNVIGDETNHVVGSFERAQWRFLRGQVTPHCAGVFKEVNEDFRTTLEFLAREAASGTVGLTISPLVNTDRNGGAYPITMQ